MNRINKKFMFWNDWMFESVHGLKRVINKPLKSNNNPIFDEPVDYPSIIYDQEAKLFKMWYSTLKGPLAKGKGFALAYATSSDGYTWEKSSLGIVEYKGSKENNLTDMTGAEIGYVYLDENDSNPERKYKLIYLTLEGCSGTTKGKTAMAI